MQVYSRRQTLNLLSTTAAVLCCSSQLSKTAFAETLNLGSRRNGVRHLDARSYVYDYEIIIDGQILDSNHHHFFVAKKIILNGNIETSGRNIILVCKDLQCKDAFLDTRFKKKPKDFTDKRAGSEKERGGDGHDGDDGGPGKIGGAVQIVAERFEGKLRIDSSGQDGGGAQSGGHGQIGKEGSFNHNGSKSCDSRGGKGGTGGMAGEAGVPGNGGNGGNISVSLVEPLPDGSSIEGVSKAGIAGKKGSHGNPGKPGPGGGANPGKERYESEYCS